MSDSKDFIETIDRVIGSRINELRISMGLSRQQLSEQIGVTHQQLQKYEKGINRISAGRLASTAKALQKPISYFFEQVSDGENDLPTKHQRMCIEVSRNFLKIKNPEHQNAINSLVKSLANNQSNFS